MAAEPGSGIVRVASRYTVGETVKRVEAALGARGIQLFALVDHSGEAAKAGLRMPATKLLIFGNPKAGTPLMVAAPTLAIDLPLKLLVSEDGDGVWISYNDPEYLRARHGLPEEMGGVLAAAGAVARAAGE